MNGLGQSEETVGGENQALEGVAVTEALRDTLKLVPGRHKVHQVRQLPDARRNTLEIESVVC